MNPFAREARLKPACLRGIRHPLPPPEDGGERALPAEARHALCVVGAPCVSPDVAYES